MDRKPLFACLAIALGPSPGLAASSMDDVVLDEVVVTARKRNENLQQVPLSISQSTGVELERRNVVRLQDMVRLAPNVSADILQPRLASISIRGLGRNPANEGLESSVGTYLDGVYLGRTGMAVTELVDLERFEILRGPQGTLFGKNATAGALVMATRKPSQVPEAWLDLNLGNYALRQFKGMATGPLLQDQLAFRATGFATERRGFVTNTATGEHLAELSRIGGRAQLLWTPAADISARLIADYSSQDEAGPGYLLVDPAIHFADGSLRPNNFLERAARVGYTPVFDPQSRRTDAEAAYRMATDQAGLSLQVDWSALGHTLTSLSAWRKWNFRPQNDGDATAMRVQPKIGASNHDWQASQELRLASPTGQSLDYLLGVNVFVQSVRSVADIAYGADAAAFFQAGLPRDVLDGFSIRTYTNPRTQSYAAFGQLGWQASERLRLATGLRWTTEYRDALVQQSSTGGATLAPGDARGRAVRAQLGSPFDADLHSHEGFLAGELSASWHLATAAMAYAAVSRGAKSGGINAAVVPAGTPQQIDPEIAVNYELGLKSRWFAQRLQANLSLFSTTVEDFQATVRDPARGVTFITNAGSVRSRGVELDTSWRPVQALTLTLASGWQDARYTSFHSSACPPEYSNLASCDFTGQRVVGSPRWTASSTVEYRAPVGNGRQVAFAGMEYFHSAAYRAELSTYTAIDAYDLVNVRAGLASSNERWSCALWVRNLFDVDYYTTKATGAAFNSGLAYGLLGEPRLYGISLRLQF